MTRFPLAAEQFDGIIFDFDGTLVDSFTPIHSAFNHMLRQFGHTSELTYAQMLALVGGPLEGSVARLLPPSAVSEGTRIFRDHYARIYLDQTVPMAGARTLLKQLDKAGKRKAVVTNKLGHSARELIGHFSWQALLPLCLGEGDGFLLKPAPDMVLAAADRLKISPDKILFVGDSPFDLEAARNAGVPVCLLSTGTHHRKALEALEPDLLFDNLSELGTWFGQGIW